MTCDISVVLKCDNPTCDEVIVTDARDCRRARLQAERNNWDYGEKGDICPEHAKQGKKL